jgi:hypothetical protein
VISSSRISSRAVWCRFQAASLLNTVSLGLITARRSGPAVCVTHGRRRLMCARTASSTVSGSNWSPMMTGRGPSQASFTPVMPVVSRMSASP